MAIILSQSTNIKLPMWACDPGMVAYNCARLGLPVPILPMPFWEGGNKVYDYSGHGNHGTLQNDVHFVPDKSGLVLDFDGTGDYVNIPDTDALSFGDSSIDTPFSVVVSVLMRDATDFGICCKGDDNVINCLEWGFTTSTDDKLYGVLWGQGDPGYTTYSFTNNTLTSDENKWIHLVMTYDGSSSHTGIKLYKDGIAQGAGGSTHGNYVAMANTARAFNIGAYIRLDGTYGKHANGLIDHIYIYDQVLNAAQVKLLCNNHYGMFEPPRRPIWIVGIPPTTLAPTTPYQTTIGPTTKPPTTGPATTVPPTTFYPSTEAPTTSLATTVPPTTLAPTTLAPTSLLPTTLAPTTEAPTSIAPTTLFQTTVGPTTKAPTTAALTTLAPTTSPPTTVFPTTEPFTTPIPTTVAPTTLQPTTAIPTTLAPTTAEPTTLAPTTVAFTTLAPTTLAPTTIGPTTIPSTTVAPTTSVPTTTLTTIPPTTAAPETICIKALNSIITEEIPLRSLITKEIRFNGYLC